LLLQANGGGNARLYGLGLSAMIARTVSEQLKNIASPPFAGARGYRLPDDRAAQHYAAIVESSEDAILSKDLDGVITSWNHGAERLFGYAPGEVVGRPVTILIPGDRDNEEPMILERIRRGERIEHYETVRRRKDGSLVDISLTVSPIRDPAGKIIGASKIARDITERRRANERRQLLLGEMNHRIKNLFALAISVVSLSGRSANSVEELIVSARERLLALARAHELTLSRDSVDAPHVEMPTTLHSLIRAIVAPYESIRNESAQRFEIVGPDIAISGAAVSTLALLLNEFSTNSAKYGAPFEPEGANSNRLRGRGPGDRAHVDGAQRAGRHVLGRQRRIRLDSDPRRRRPAGRRDVKNLGARRPGHPAVGAARPPDQHSPRPFHGGSGRPIS
jgi:PAS domain S-box-containing protein